MPLLINRQNCLDIYKKSPQSDPERDLFFYPKTFRNYILALHSKSIKGHAKQLGIEVSMLATALPDVDKLFFLGNTATTWRNQDNDYKPVKEALQYLEDQNIEKTFDGAIMVTLTELPLFIKHLFWLTRCNASLPDFHFMDTAQNYLGNICKYGNLHISAMSNVAGKHLIEAIGNSKFVDVTDEKCYNRFGKTSIIAHRQLIV